VEPVSKRISGFIKYPRKNLPSRETGKTHPDQNERSLNYSVHYYYAGGYEKALLALLV
jgi:hypothetical protein